jgi:hypothetical protein
MPKRGERLPWRVEYEYPPSDRCPDGIKGVEVRYDPETAAIFADTLARRGASGRVINRDTGKVIATFHAKSDDVTEPTEEPRHRWMT